MAQSKSDLIIYMSNLYTLMLNLDKTGQEYADKKSLFAEEYRIACDEYTDIIEKEHHERAGTQRGSLSEADRRGHEDGPRNDDDGSHLHARSGD
jgi:hypothetical protein